MQLEIGILYVWILVDVIDTLGVEGTGAAFNAMYHVAFFQQEFGQVRAVLASDAGDESGSLMRHGLNEERGKIAPLCPMTEELLF